MGLALAVFFGGVDFGRVHQSRAIFTLAPVYVHPVRHTRGFYIFRSKKEEIAMASKDTGHMPITAKQAVEQWNAGNPVPVFQAEGDPERQQAIWAVAFEMIGGDYALTQDFSELRRLVPGAAELSEREFHTAHSIAYVSMKIGWSRMVSQHVGRDTPPMMLQKAK